MSAEVHAPRDVDPELSNEKILQKWRALTKGAIDDGRRKKTDRLCLEIKELDDVLALNCLMSGVTKNPIE